MVTDRVRVWVKVSVWVRFRVGIWDTFRLLLSVKVEVISFRIGWMIRLAGALGGYSRGTQPCKDSPTNAICACVFGCLSVCVSACACDRLERCVCV